MDDKETIQRKEAFLAEDSKRQRPKRKSQRTEREQLAGKIELEFERVVETRRLRAVIPDPGIIL